MVYHMRKSFAGHCPSYVAATLPNAYYRSAEEYEQALCDALREEYHAIVDAGFILQIDDPRLVSYYMMHPNAAWPTAGNGRHGASAINDSIRDIPPEKVRFHTCYSIDVGPRIHEMALQDIVDIMQINAGAYSFEAANPRHEHEYHVFEQVKLPEGKVLIPGHQSHHEPGRAPRTHRRTHRAVRQTGWA